MPGMARGVSISIPKEYFIISLSVVDHHSVISRTFVQELMQRVVCHTIQYIASFCWEPIASSQNRQTQQISNVIARRTVHALSPFCTVSKFNFTVVGGQRVICWKTEHINFLTFQDSKQTTDYCSLFTVHFHKTKYLLFIYFIFSLSLSLCVASQRINFVPSALSERIERECKHH